MCFIVTNHSINKQEIVQTSSNAADILSATKKLINRYVNTRILEGFPKEEIGYLSLYDPFNPQLLSVFKPRNMGIMIKFSIIDTDVFASCTTAVNGELQGAKILLVVYSFIIHLKNMAICQ